jgi:Spy/CpxP family protein refolding chaperone
MNTQRNRPDPSASDGSPTVASSPRRRWFGGGPRRRWRFLGVGAAALAGALALGACGHHHGGGYGPNGGFAAASPEEAARRIDKMVTWVLSDVDATDVQKRQVGDIAKAAMKDLAPLREQHKDLRRRGVELMAAAAVDRNAMEVLRGDALKLADTASRRATQAFGDALDVLTPQQRSQLAERAKKRWS